MAASGSNLSAVDIAGNRELGPITKWENARKYLEENKVNQMFDSLMASLMLEKPEDHFKFLDGRLEEIKEKGIENVNWETFIHHLHPTRNDNRLDYIHDAVWEKERPQEDQKKIESAENVSESEMQRENTEEDYKPQLFNLTEAVED